ncbi:hypothetical protein JL100_012570 [Skermanella mucosa]|uniref:hypothetical protein n=1 Tax=Skermanella mucosa TaxID=1789672 RepID=UPI00192AA16E|nr:hypothetical protein [Skermanella mucosa]UEM23525.1 hypothetical protein JL100_012570 [Skermanella mucosa]
MRAMMDDLREFRLTGPIPPTPGQPEPDNPADPDAPPPIDEPPAPIPVPPVHNPPGPLT